VAKVSGRGRVDHGAKKAEVLRPDKRRRQAGGGELFDYAARSLVPEAEATD
jgi:hypothetical protein